MKKSLSKKILAMFLAVLMLVTAVPFTSFAATETELNDLNAAITAYENKMNGTVYTNMKSAYDAYIVAREAKDAYVYGNNKSADLAKATQELKAATEKMQNFAEPQIQFTAPVWPLENEDKRDNVSLAHYSADASKNVVYAGPEFKDANQSAGKVNFTDPGVTKQDNVPGSNFAKNGGFDFEPCYGTIVLLYDGVNEMQFPVMAKAKVNNPEGKHEYRLITLYPTNGVKVGITNNRDNNAAKGNYQNSSEFALYRPFDGFRAPAADWCSSNSNGLHYGFNVVGINKSQYIGAQQENNAGNYSTLLSANNYSYYSSVLQFKGQLAADEYVRTYNIRWAATGEDKYQKNFFSKTEQQTFFGEGAATTPTYVLNYKAVKDAIAEAAKLTQIKDVATYSDENSAQMSTLMGVIDKATSFNPNNYSYANDAAAAVAECDKDIKAIVEGIKAGANIGTAFAYAKLRSSIDESKAVYEAGNGETGKPIFQPQTWDRFEKAYKAAIDKMNKLPQTHYVDVDGIMAVEKELADSFVNLARIDLTILKDAITAYETKMNGTIYTNMKPAYDAYIVAKEAIDAFEYGNNKTVQFDRITKELEEATANMKEFVSPEIKFTVPTWSTKSAEDIEYTKENSKNILYAGPEYTTGKSVGKMEWQKNGDDGKFDVNLYYGTTVLLYDGTTIPQFPVMASAAKGNKSSAEFRRIINIYPATTPSVVEAEFEDNKDFRVSLSNIEKNDKDSWAGGRDGGNQSYGYNIVHDGTGSDATQYIRGAWTNKTNDYSDNMTMASGTWYFSSSLKYNNTMGPNTYVQDFQIPWNAHTTLGASGFGLRASFGSTTSTVHTYVVNYKAVKDAIADASKLTQIKDVATYSDENYKAMSDLMGAIDKATSFNPNSFDYATDTATAIQQCDTIIKEIVEGVKAGSNIKVATTYRKLRYTISLAKSTYEMGNGTPENPTFTQDSWTRFETAYKAAVEEMKGLPEKHYKDAGIVELEKELTTARENLKSFKQASFDVYNYAVKNLVDKVAQGKWTAKSLEQLEAELKTKKYIDKANQVNVPITEQPSINAETKEIERAEQILKAADNSVFEAMKVDIKTINADSSNVAQIQQEFDKLSANTTKKITILGVEYDGYIYDEIVSSVITKINETKYDYTIKVVDEANNTTKYVVMDAQSKAISYTEDEMQATKFHYDDKLTLTNDVACDWATTVVAQSTATESTRKVVNTNSTSYEFSVRGNTTVYLSAATSASSHKVTFVDSRSNEVVAFGYTSNGTFDISTVNVPNYAYYDIKGYACNVEGVVIEGTTISGVSKDIIVTVNYEPSQSVGEYTVRFEDAFGAVLETKTVKYNQLVTLTKEGAKYFTDKATGKVLWTGDTYSFYAHQNVTVVAHADEKTFNTVDVSVTSSPIVSNGVTRFVGSFAQVPSRYKVLNYGVVVDFDNRYAADLSLAKVNKSEKVYNLSASSCDAKSNQFVVGVTGTYTNINYVSYVICEDTTTGYSQIFYSNIIHA